MAGDAGAEHLSAWIVAEGCQRIFWPSDSDGANGRTRERIPAPDHAIAAACQKSCVIRQENCGPDGQPGTDQRGGDRAAAPIDDGDCAPNVSGGDPFAIPGKRKRHNRDTSARHLAGSLSRWRDEKEAAI